MTTFMTMDGRQVFIRRIETDDATLLVDLFHHLSEQTRRLRFHCASTKCPDELIRQEATKLSHLDSERQVALAAIMEDSDGQHAVGTARLARRTPQDIEAEVGVIVRDDFQGVGLGTHLMFRLAQIARSMDITQFKAWVLPENRKMLRLIKKTGLPIKQDLSRGEIHLVVSIDQIEPLTYTTRS